MVEKKLKMNIEVQGESSKDYAFPSKNHIPKLHPSVQSGKVGILLINLGTPDGTDYWSMRRYLAEFLTDKRVIEWPKFIWYPILYGIVLLRRPRKSGKAYRSIWNLELDESPLRTTTRSQAKKLAGLLGERDNVTVDWAMRYGKPSISEKLLKLKNCGCDRLLIFPMYPQYSASTTASVNDRVFETLLKFRWQPAIRIVPPYHDNPTYIKALAQSILEKVSESASEPELVLVSFHGIPKSYFEKGDPYHCHCQKTTRLLREELGWDEGKLKITFQSRFGPEEWLQPYTDKTIMELAQNGKKHIAVVNPGFVTDCLETLEEIAIEGAKTFKENGGEELTHIPCLNDNTIGMTVLHDVVRRELGGWI